MKAAIVIVLVLVAIAATRTAATGHTPTRPVGSTTATVVGSEYERDPDHPAGTHYADCRAADGSQYRVVVSADTEYRLREGQPCPDGPHMPTTRQANPALYDEVSAALNAPMPYHGGDANGPCGEWEATDQANADAMRAAYDQCMTHQGGVR